jgi:cyclopropane-fatty-acyl-phospholipid synthase
MSRSPASNTRSDPADLPVASLSIGTSLSITGRFLRRMLRAIELGQLTVQMPSGERFEHVAAKPGPHAILVLNAWRTVRRVLIGGHLAFAEAYIDGDWDSPDLATLIEFFALNQDAFGGDIDGSLGWRVLNRIKHRLRPNTRRGSRRNIVAHYDLGNAFYASWLDRGMTYSSALFDRPGLSLEDAQEAKISRVVEALALQGGERVLEIGCGWGALAERLIRESGCTVTGLTLSPAQREYAVARVDSAGLSDRADLRLQDYREVTGTFDRIVSIEMLEAVGAEYWPAYFAKLKACMTQRGRAVLQVITIAERHFADYSREPDFIQRYIFPGGMLPTATLLREHIARAGLVLRSAENFGESYAITLAEWQRRFQHSWPGLLQLGFDPAFRRKWEYYLSYCEAGFRAGTIDVGLYEVAHAGVGHAEMDQVAVAA